MKDFLVILLILAILGSLWGIGIYGELPEKYWGPLMPENMVAGFSRLIGGLTGTSNESIKEYVDDLYILTNGVRVRNDLKEFIRDPLLEELAQKHAEDMCNRTSVDHNGFDLRSDIAMGKGYHTIAENVAGGFYDASSCLQGWMNSFWHAANILNSGLTHIGIGAYGHYTVQFFAGY